MSDNFNVKQFVSAFFSISAKAITGKPINNANGANFAQAMPTEAKAIIPQVQLQNMIEIPRMQLELLNSLDKGALVKELMNLPKDFTQLVSMFTTTQNGINQAALMDISKLIAFLQQNGEVGKQNLLNLIVSINKAGFTQTEQLKELSYIINACMPSAQNTTATIMKNLILLYLPWLPLGEGVGFDIEVKNGTKDEGGEEDDSVTIYIKTLNYGAVKVLLKVEGKTKIIMQIHCDDKFPKNIAEKLFKQEVENFNISSEIEFSKDKQSKEDEEKFSQTQVNVNTSRHINPLLMMSAHTIIRIVFEIDKNVIEVNPENEE